MIVLLFTAFDAAIIRPCGEYRLSVLHRLLSGWSTLLRQRLAAPAHSHVKYDETIYGLEGVLTWTGNGQSIEVGVGQVLCIPRGAIHRFDNHGSQDARALCLITTAAVGPEFFRESAEVLNASPEAPPDRAKMAEVMRRHGLTPAPPPQTAA